jgi:hypothetical protein
MAVGTISIQTINLFSKYLFFILVVSFVKGCLIFFLINAAIRFVKFQSPEAKHILWISVVCSFLLIPFFSVVGPFLGVKVPFFQKEGFFTALTSLISRSAGFFGADTLSQNITPALYQGLHSCFIPRFSTISTFFSSLGVLGDCCMGGRSCLLHLENGCW